MKPFMQEPFVLRRLLAVLADTNAAEKIEQDIFVRHDEHIERVILQYVSKIREFRGSERIIAVFNPLL